MKRLTVSAMACLLLISAVRADSIDEAEAKRRGVPVAQVQAESALVQAKAKTAAMEKEIADLQARIAELKAAPSGSTPGVADAGLNFDGPRGESPMYDDFVKRYLAGDWDKLGADMEAKKKDIAALPAGNAADLTYIMRAVAESRPVWWNDVKSGKTKDFRQLVWRQAVQATYASAGMADLGAATTTGFQVRWPRDMMDSHDTLSLMQYGLAIPGDYGFSMGDANNTVVWQVLGNAASRAVFTGDGLKKLSSDDQIIFARHNLFWQNITAAYYCTPPGRRLICAMSLSSLETAMNGNSNWIGRRPLGAALLLELAQNKEKYKGLQVQSIIGLEKLGDASKSEEFLAKPVVMEFLHARLTFEQDRRLREMIKTLATSNSKWSESKLTLPANQSYDLDSAKDAAVASDRVKAESR